MTRGIAEVTGADDQQVDVRDGGRQLNERGDDDVDAFAMNRRADEHDIASIRLQAQRIPAVCDLSLPPGGN